MNLEAHIKSFLKNLKEENKSENTIKTYKTTLDGMLSYIEIEHANSNDIRFSILSYVYSLNKELSVSSINTKRITIRRFIKYLASNGIIMDFSSEIKTLKKESSKERETLNTKEIKACLDLLNDEIVKSTKKDLISKTKTKLIFLILIYTGMKVSELVNLRWSDINFLKEEIHIQDSKKRDLPLNMELKTNLLTYKNLLIDSEFSDDDKVIDMSVRNVEYIIKNIISKADIKKNITPNALRHTLTKCLIKNDVDIKTISEILGHSSVEITFDLYSKDIESDKKKHLSNLKYI